MHHVIIFHGYGETPESYWYPYLKRELYRSGYEVLVPALPHTNDPALEEQLDFALKNFRFSDSTILIGHSSGCSLILSVLEKIEIPILQAILVAGYSGPLKIDSGGTKNIKENFDWESIKKHCKDFIFINADNDPWGADDEQGKIMQQNLGGRLIVNHEGHMGSDRFKQPYKEFPLLLEIIK